MKRALVITGAVIGLIALVILGFYLWGKGNITRVQAVELNEFDISQMPDGRYAGVEPFMFATYEVSIRIESGKIVDAVHVSDDGREYAVKARAILQAVVEKQSVVGVDAISGATIASKVFLNAAQNALEKAAGDSGGE